MFKDKEIIINLFIAGSKSLQAERDLFSSNINKLQTFWNNKDSRVRIFGYSYANFDKGLTINGQQYAYNKFIKEQTDIIIFVLDGEVGGITIKEFDVAWRAFKKNNRPKIFVFSNNNGNNHNIEFVRKKVDSCGQYWLDYEKDQLRDKMYIEMSECVQDLYDKIKAEYSSNDEETTAKKTQ